MKEELFTFGDFKLRRAHIGDLALAHKWTEADFDHAGKVDARFWIDQTPWAQSYLLSDHDGPLFFFKGVLKAVTAALEIHVQFPPYPVRGLTQERHWLRNRLMNGLIEGTRWLEGQMAGVVNEFYFESSNPSLITFCQTKLGFSQERGRLIKRLGQEARLAQKGS